MPEIGFFVEGIRPLEPAASPTLALSLRAINATPEPVHSMLVRCQIQIEPALRRYSAVEQRALADIFAAPERWGETLRSFHWQQVTLLVPGFTGTAVTELPLPCSVDIELAATKYFEALESGSVPLRFYFSGTVFYAGGAGVQAAPLAWSLEAAYHMPVAAWKQCVERHYPGCRWLRLRRETYNRLCARRAALGHARIEQTIEALLNTPADAVVEAA